MADEGEGKAEEKGEMPADYASESRLSGDYSPPASPPRMQMISESEVDVAKILRESRESIPPGSAPNSAGAGAGAGPSSASASIPPPPSTIVENAMERGQRMPLSRMLGIGAAIFVVLIGLTLLLFR